jgi:hypothetical protein
MKSKRSVTNVQLDMFGNVDDNPPIMLLSIFTGNMFSLATEYVQ